MGGRALVKKLEAAKAATGSKLAKTDAYSMYKRLDRSILSMLFTSMVSSNNNIIISSCMMTMLHDYEKQGINTCLEKFQGIERT